MLSQGWCFISRWWPRAALLALAIGAGPAPAQDAAALQVELGSHAGAVRRIAVDPSRDWVLTGGDDKTARVWGLGDGALRQVLRPPVGADEGGRVYGVALHPQQPWAAVGGTSAGTPGQGPALLIFDVRSGETLKRFDARAGDVKRLLWTADGRLLVAGYAGRHGVRAFDTEGREVFADDFPGGVYALAFKAGVLAAAGLDGSLRLYRQAEAGRVPAFALQAQLSLDMNPVSLAFSPTADALAVGYFKPGRAPDVVDLRTRAVTAGVAPPALERDTLMSVAWSADGRRVLAAGAYPSGRRNARLVSFEPGSRRFEEAETGAPSTVTDLLPLADGRLAYASADGSWGLFEPAAGRAGLQRAALPDLDGAARLRISADGRHLSWTLDAGRERVGFDLARRVPTDGAQATLVPLLRRGLLDAPSDWENHRQPQVNGARIALGADEISRAVALFAGGKDAILGTSRALLRIGAGGQVLWRRQMNTEVRAVNVTPDGRLVVAAMLDGTLRVARAADGRELLALLMLRDRRWVLWTPEGAFDAAAGADRLVGWVVNRADGSGADYHPAASFRDRYHQPRLIDLLLETLDPEVAARRHAEEVTAELGTAEAAAALPAPSRPLPPVLRSPLNVLALEAPAPDAEVDAEVPVSVQNDSAGGALSFEVRVDGRPGEITQAALGPPASGAQAVQLRVRLPATALSVQLVARNRHGASEAWVLAVRATWPALGPSATAPLAAAPPALAAPAGQTPAVPGLQPLPAAPPERGRLFVLSIGVSQYQRPQYRLRLAAKDAADFAARIRHQQGKLYREVVVRQLLDGEASRANLLASLAELARAGGKRDTFMIFLAGHGVTGASGSYYFLTAEARHEDLRGTAVADRELRAALRQVPGRALLFIDTCHAGSALGATGSGRNGELARFVNDMSDNGVVVFAASAGRQESLESDEWGNGAFTTALLAGLEGKADPLRLGRVTYKGLDYFVSEEVRRLTSGRQTPVSLSPMGVPDFELARL